MKAKLRLCPGSNAVYYCEDVATGKQESLGTKGRAKAACLFHAKNEAHRQPNLNLQMARTISS